MVNRTNTGIMEKAAPYLDQLKAGRRKLEESARRTVRPREMWQKIGESARSAAKICAKSAENAVQDALEKVTGIEAAGKDGKKSPGSRSYALITGASSGIGMEFARRLSLEGYPLILVARRRDRLEALRTELGTECLLLPADLQRREDLIRLCEDLVGRRIEIFINNAGFGVAGPFLGTELMREIGMVDVNVTAQHVLLKYVLHRMQAEGGGSILNVASAAGLLPGGPYMSGYYATKAYIASLTRGVAEELREGKSPVYVGCLCPGPVDTEFNAVADVSFALPGISAEYCVDYALRMMEKKRTVIIPGWQMQLAVLGGRFLPDALTVRLTGAQQKKKLG